MKKIKIAHKLKEKILALGGQTKATLCFLEKNFTYLTEPFSDLSLYDCFKKYLKKLNYFLKKKPSWIAYDLHPEYQSTKYAKQILLSEGYRLIGVQHHHAHLASVMAENQLPNKPFLGVIFDGTGYGLDGKIWGGEFLLGNYSGFRRLAHLKEVPLIGGEQAIWQPWRLSCVWLDWLFKDFWKLKIGFVKKINLSQWRILKKLSQKNFNIFWASSIGRLFDAVGSLILEKLEIKSEAELPIALEKEAKKFKVSQKIYPYNFKILKKQKTYILDPADLFKELVKDLEEKKDSSYISFRFHFTLAWMIKKICMLIKKRFYLNGLILSGGVFQNQILLNLVKDLMKSEFKIYTHQQLAPSDSSISLGQALIASFTRK